MNRMNEPQVRVIATPEDLRAALDANRACVNFPTAPTLRRLLRGETFAWLANLTDGRLGARIQGCWDANMLDELAAATWERRRRALGVDRATAEAWLAEVAS